MEYTWETQSIKQIRFTKNRWEYKKWAILTLIYSDKFPSWAYIMWLDPSIIDSDKEFQKYIEVIEYKNPIKVNLSK